MANKNYTIAFYIGSLEKGGAERVIVNLAAHFNKQGYKVYIVTKLQGEDEYDIPAGVSRLIADITDDETSSSRIINLSRRVNKLKNIWKLIRPDIIVSFIRKNNLMALESAKSFKIPVVVSIRSNPSRELEGLEDISFVKFREAAGIVMQTRQAGDYLPVDLQSKIVILPNSLNPDFVNVEEPEERVKEIVTVGRLDDNKNQMMVINAFAKLAPKYPDWVLKLYGDGSSRDKLVQLVEYYSLEDRIIFMGQVSDVQDKIKNSSIFTLTSNEEGMPNALIEAMALGLAVVSTDCPCGGPAELIEDGKNGFLVKTRNTDELGYQLDRLMGDEELRQTLGKAAKDSVRKLKPEVVNAKWQEYIEGIIEKNK